MKEEKLAGIVLSPPKKNIIFPAEKIEGIGKTAVRAGAGAAPSVTPTPPAAPSFEHKAAKPKIKLSRGVKILIVVAIVVVAYVLLCTISTS